MPMAVVELGFSPVIELGDLGIRWQSLGVVAALLAGLAVAAREVLRQAPALRLEHLVYVALGVVPGAVVGGRLAHGLAFAEYYSADPLRLVDPHAGSLSLLGAVIGGTLSAAYVTLLLRASVRRWADLAAVPLLLTLGLGKVAQLLGGSGQGQPFDGPWAVAFTGPGPWASPNPDLPAHPAQLYEAVWLLAGAALLVIRPGALRAVMAPLVFALGWFLAGRVLTGFTWRDDPLLGPFNSEQVMALGVLLVGAVALARSNSGKLRRGGIVDGGRSRT
jgi:prolipoprotein diacylglyceryltransferase